MKKTVLLLLVFFIAMSSYSQYYEKNFGVRLGSTSGFSFKTIKNESSALEGIIGFRNGGLQFYGLLEVYKKAFTSKTDGFRVFYGPGIHFGFVTYRYNDCCSNPYNQGSLRFFPVLGIDGIIGLEYKFPMNPVVVGFDFKPFIEFEGFYNFKVNFWDFGIFVKYSIF
jgi:hypothetical protein